MTDRPIPAVADLYGDLETSASTTWKDHVPGLIVAVLATLAAGYLSDHYGAPLTLMALLIGLSLNFLGGDARLNPGLSFAARELLRWGIVFVGVRVTFGQIISLGPTALLVILTLITLTMFGAVKIAERTRFGRDFGLLAGGAVAICGASAALAIAAVLGEKRISQAQLALVLVGISAMSAFAMFAYPILAHIIGLSDRQAGFMLGAAIHDVAQSLGAGYAYSNTAGDFAAITKLTRVALLAPVLALIGLMFVKDRGKTGPAALIPPWFIIGFFIVAALNSMGHIPAQASTAISTAGSALLACAVAATAIRAPMGKLIENGVRPLYTIAGGTLIALTIAALAARFLIS
jgi:uncharacterized integral membrane protein (TIGR00698 family)